MKKILYIFALLALALPAQAQKQLREATAAEVAAGTAGLPAVVTPRRMAANTNALTAAQQSTLDSSPVIASNTLVVSVYGNNDTASRGKFNKPWATLSAASSNALAGDAIIVLPGIYNDNNQCGFALSNTVSFEKGAKVYFTNGLTSGSYDSFMYMPWVSGLKVYNADITALSTGRYSAVTGMLTNNAAVSNVFFSGCTFRADADTIYNRCGNLATNVVFDGCDLRSRYDVFASIYSAGTFSANANSSVTILNSYLEADSSFITAGPGDAALFRASGGKLTVQNCRGKISNKAGNTVYGFLCPIASQGSVVSVNNVFDVNGSMGATTIYDFVLNDDTMTANVTIGSTYRFDGQTLMVNNATLQPVNYFTSTGPVRIPMGSDFAGDWLLSPANDSAGTLFIRTLVNQAIANTTATNSIDANGVYRAAGYGIFGGSDGLNSTVSIQTNSVGPHGIRIIYVGGIATGTSIY